MSKFLSVFRGVRFPHHVGDRITRDEAHHQKDDECHPKQCGDQEQQATQEIFSHSVPVLGRYYESLASLRVAAVYLSLSRKSMRLLRLCTPKAIAPVGCTVSFFLLVRKHF